MSKHNFYGDVLRVHVKKNHSGFVLSNEKKKIITRFAYCLFMSIISARDTPTIAIFFLFFIPVTKHDRLVNSFTFNAIANQSMKKKKTKTNATGLQTNSADEGCGDICARRHRCAVVDGSYRRQCLHVEKKSQR